MHNKNIFMNYDVYKIRRDFPILQQQVYNKPLIYLDNGATTQKPQPVIDCVHDLLYFQKQQYSQGRALPE